MGKVNGGLLLSPHPAPCLSLKQLGLLYKLSHAGQYNALSVSTNPSPPTCPLLPMPPPLIPHLLPQPHSCSQTLISTLTTLMHHHANTHSPSSHPHAESPPPPPPPSNSAPSVPSDPFLEGTPTLLGGPPSGPVPQE